MRVYVYLQLPGELEVVTAGLYEQSERGGVNRGTFVYNPKYLRRADAVPLEPFELGLKAAPIETVKLNGIFGALRDASPDAWGRHIIERHLGRTDVSEIEFLLHSPEDRAGALSFGRGKAPPNPTTRFNRVVQLESLLEFADAVETEQQSGIHNPAITQMEQLLQPGTSMGGARPKNVVETDEGLWIAKFPERNDRWNNARVEASMLLLARECGIKTAEPRIVTVGGRDVLLVRRFDRVKVEGGYLRHRMVSALTVLGSGDTFRDRTDWSYPRFADELRRRSRQPDADLLELFRRVTFNALISNTDDHPRNHALLAPARDWELSPAYDLTPNPLTSVERRDLAMSVGSHGRFANYENLISSAAQFRLMPVEASEIVTRMMELVSARWHPLMRSQGVSESDCGRLAGAFVYPGFTLDPNRSNSAGL